mmetsp:Transcript_9670/g.23948  ORF Transcript_9670/g.23948 Transcript_9670/m.23948 type:complete len:871 (-) Transcript_9670:317-2929(-)
MRVVPHSPRDDNLHLLPPRKTTDARVRSKLGLQAHVPQLLLDELGRQGARSKTQAQRLLLVQALNHLGPPHLLELLTRQPRVVLVRLVEPLDLVLVGTLGLPARAQRLDNQLLHSPVLAADDVHLLHVLLLLLGELLGLLLVGLAVLARAVAPLDVLVGRLIEVLLEVVEGVLGNVGDTHVLVAPHGAGLGLGLAAEHLDDGRLAGAVGADHGNARRERGLERDVAHGGLVLAGVGEGAVVHLDDGLALGLDAVEQTGLGEGEGEVLVRELVVGLGAGHALDEGRQVALVVLELAVVLVVDDMGDDAVEETRVVRHDARRHGGERREVVLEPRDVGDVQVVGGLVEQEDVGVHEHSAGKRELHLPAAGKAGHDGVDAGRGVGVLDEAEIGEALPDVGLGALGAHVAHVLDDGHVLLRALDVVLNVHSLEHVLGGEPVNLAVGNRTHEGGLAAAVVAADAVALAALQVKARVVEKDLGTIAERELAVAKVLALLVLVLGGLLGRHLLEAARLERGADADGVGLGQEGREVGAHGDELPLEVVEVEVVDHARHHGGDVFEVGADGRIRHLERGRGGRHSLKNGGHAHLGAHALLLLLGVDLVLQLLERLERLVGDTAGLRVRELVGEALDAGHQLGEEGLGLAGVVDELGHVVDDDGNLALDLCLLLGSPADEEGHRDGERGGVDRLHEHGGRERVHGLGNLLGRLDGLDEGGHKGLDVPVVARGARELHGLGGHLLDLLLGVPHRLGDDGDGLRERLGEGEGMLVGELAQEHEGPHLGLPLGVGNGLVDHGLDGLHGPGAGARHEGGAGLLSESADLGLLVSAGPEDRGEEGHDEGLDDGAAHAGERLDGDDGVLQSLGLLNHLLQRVDRA